MAGTTQNNHYRQLTRISCSILLFLLLTPLALCQADLRDNESNLEQIPAAPELPLAPVPINPPSSEIETNTPSLDLQNLLRQTTVRIMTSDASGSGVIIEHQGQIYTVLTNWHVVAFSDQHTIITPDGQKYTLNQPPQQLGDNDLAVLKFSSNNAYQVALISNNPLKIGEKTFAAGFPMYQPGSLETTFEQGIDVFQFTVGEISLIPPKSLAQGYSLGYSNDIRVGMSGGPIFNAQGLLIGVNGRTKNRDPDFGVYLFADGTEPPPEMLAQMISSSWGIPISTYLQFIPSLNSES